MFTNREKEIIILISKGLTSIEIAEVLFISIETVKTHRKNIKQKINLEEVDSGSLLKFAINFAIKRDENTH
ncbi:response regulator transcription factor [Dyadobacter frigoris]|uniref:Helix-turn-helix transcriptional regulator n=1 Tax=Dyadobacter frigoris TaxID=2576211 RepID=A0A4U6CRZ4_9BACT|nr:helix-turn-helix transcriptional regulator [Dyadobacter frigoris]TKT87352.1 helix-turn-helix transcriptional regulator [Dyadobacter frigoris]GLU55657.1 hypothetical protein Dfri01_51180 [Dyadobacter frigoris]